MAVRTEPSERWVRGYVGDVAVVDSRRPLLFYEETRPVPHYAFAREDVREGVLRETSEDPPDRPSFFQPQGPVATWYDVEVGERRLSHAAWVRDAPELSDRVIFSWMPGVLDRWLEEEEEVGGHPRDPHARVDALPSSRHVVVSSQGVVLADTSTPVVLFETGLPTRYYLPAGDVDFAKLTPTGTQSRCPYKGCADSYWDVAIPGGPSDVAWSYSDPVPAVHHIKGRVAFYNELVDIEVDGVLQDRPRSPFSVDANRPSS